MAASTTGPAPGRTRSKLSFGWSVALVVLGGMVVRLVYLLVVSRQTELGLDSTWYLLEGGLLKGGYGYIDPGTLFNAGRSVSTAAWTPLYPVTLAVFVWLGIDTTTGLRMVGLGFAAATIALSAVLARRVFRDDTVAVVAAAIVAVSPVVVATDMSLMSEAMSVPMSLLVLLVAQRLFEHRRLRDLALVGLVVGLGTLARTDVALLGGLAALGVLVAARVGWREVVRGLVVIVGVAGVVLVPWVARNQAAVGAATVSTVSTSTAIAGANCDAVYGGTSLGSWEFECIDDPSRTAENEAEWSATVLRRGLRYAADHPGSLPTVAAARTLRVWGAWDPRDQTRREAGETRDRGWQVAAWVFDRAVIVAAAAAVVLLRARWRSMVVLLAPLVAVTLIALLTYGNQRFRAPAEPSLAILAAWSICHLWRRRTTGSPALSLAPSD
jgi:hypothetical protein